MTTYYVSNHGHVQAKGTQDDPFLTIDQSQDVVKAGDTVIVREGVYREWVKPRVQGLSDKRRITYKAAAGEKVEIKGSEVISNWEHVEGDVYRVKLPRSFFGSFNPFAETVHGDWLLTEEVKHLGEVYLNGQSLYEASNYEDVITPKEIKETVDHWTGYNVPVKDVAATKRTWMAKVTDEETIIHANFQGVNPNDALVEINVRPACFLPTETGMNYYTVSGFHMSQAASPWSPPTADQPGLLGANWSKGWIIENNVIHDAKCSAISLGKEKSTGHNFRTYRKDKPGYQYQLESVFSAQRNGWSKEKIGGHLVKNNTIYDCGQNAVVGHLGCIFSEITDNHIYNIGTKREFFGHEIAGIKLHAAIDVKIEHNLIHDCSLGLWLDWQTQGTKIDRNIFYDNTRDFFVEVSHGPYVVSNNIFTAHYAIDNVAQGGAYINNLIAGFMVSRPILDRSTQYHLPHSTEVAGFSLVYGGDDRFYNNIFTGRSTGEELIGTSHFNGHPDSLESYISLIGHDTKGDLDSFLRVNQPVYIHHNAYFGDAKAYEDEKESIGEETEIAFSVITKDDGVYLELDIPQSLAQAKGDIITTDHLTRTRITDLEFYDTDATELVLDRDLVGNKRDDLSTLGPISGLSEGKQTVKIWSY